jgi:hypothetical protein
MKNTVCPVCNHSYYKSQHGYHCGCDTVKSTTSPVTYKGWEITEEDGKFLTNEEVPVLGIMTIGHASLDNAKKYIDTKL